MLAVQPHTAKVELVPVGKSKTDYDEETLKRTDRRAVLPDVLNASAFVDDLIHCADYGGRIFSFPD